MKKNIGHKNVLATLFVLSSLSVLPLSRASDDFQLKCGNKITSYQNLSLKSDSDLVPINVSCLIEQIKTSDISVVCEGGTSYKKVDCHFGLLPTDVSFARMSMGSYGGQIDKSRIVINSWNP